MALNHDQEVRYGRQMILPQIGRDGQEQLLASRVLVVGAGGLGSPVLIYLAAAGVGTLGIIDGDDVDRSNLHRQILYADDQVGQPKARCAAARLRALNPDVKVETHGTRIRSDNAMEIVKGYDLVVDACDNFPTRYLVNDVCVMLGRPLVYGAIDQFHGQVSVFRAPGGPCYRCLFPEPPPPAAVPTCAEAGVIGVLPGVVGLVQATEAIKLLLGLGAPLLGRLLLYDALAMTFRTIDVRRNAGCPVCGDRPTITAPVDYEGFCGLRHAPPDGHPDITAAQLRDRLARGEAIALLDVRTPMEQAGGSIGGAICIPLATLMHRRAELERLRAHEIVIYCHNGMRSAHACALLRAEGFHGARNLHGGYAAWQQANTAAE